MKSYIYPAIVFKKKWFWFADPFEVLDADLVNFFSYNNVNIEGFKKKNGLTSVIDLSQNADDIWNKMRKNFIRKQIQRGERNGIVIKQDKNFKGFEKIYKTFRKDKQISHDKREAFEKNGILFSAYFEDQMIAGGVYITDGEFVRAWALASLRLDKQNGKMRDLIGQANRMIIWEAIKYFKNKENHIFDLGGIKPDSDDKTQRSLAEFKEAFGGERKECYYYYRVYSKLLRLLMKFR